MTTARPNSPISNDLLTAVEKLLGPLPADYRKFLQKHNGIRFDIDPEFPVTIEDEIRYWSITELYGIPATAVDAGIDLHETCWGEIIPRDSIPIASDGCGNDYVMALHGPRRGHIFFADHEAGEPATTVESLQHLLPSFASLFESLVDYPPNDPEAKQHFHQMKARQEKHDAQRQQIYSPSKPWWKFW